MNFEKEVINKMPEPETEEQGGQHPVENDPDR